VPTQLIVAYDAELPAEVRARCRDFSEAIALTLGDIVMFAGLDVDALDDMRAWTLAKTRGTGVEGVEPLLLPSASVTPPLSLDDDGAPDWKAFAAAAGELALFNGAPARTAAAAIDAPDPNGDTMRLNDVVMELRRGIFEVTGLFSEPVAPCWLAVSCDSRRMAAWVTAAMLLENVEARAEGDVLLVPASPDYRLEDEGVAIIAALAKVLRYWRDHLAPREETDAAL